MVRIRARILNHDGTPQKPRMWEALGRAGAYVNRLIESDNAFILIADAKQMEIMT